MFGFDLETCNVDNQIYCEAFAASVYHLSRLNERFKGDLTEKEIEIERQHVRVFDRENGNFVKDMVNYVLKS